MQDQTLGNSKVNREILGRSRWKTFLIVAVSAVVVLFAVSFLFLRFFGGTGPRTVTKLPKNFPTNFLFYRMGLSNQIVYYPASEKAKPFQLIMAPVKAVASLTGQGDSVAESIDRFLGVVRKNETVTVSWKDVDAKADDVLAYYATALRVAGIADPQMRQTEEKDVSQIIGTSSEGLSVSVLLVDNEGTPLIDTMTVTVEYPAK
jgi:hypothetical protein